MLDHLALQFIERDTVTIIGIELREDKDLFLMGNLRINCLQKLIEVLETQLGLSVVPHLGEEFLQIYVLRLDAVPEL